MYYHETFIPDDDYNPIYKIENSELELIRNVRQMINDYDIKNPKIINQTFYMGPFIKNSSYLIGKEKRYNYAQYDDVSFELYLIFFPHDFAYDNFRPENEPKYNQVIDLLKKCGYDILIVDNGLYLDIDGEYTNLADYVCKDGTYSKSEYSTAKYAVIKLR